MEEVDASELEMMFDDVDDGDIGSGMRGLEKKISSATLDVGMSESVEASVAATARAVDLGDLSMHEALNDDDDDSDEGGEGVDAARAAVADKKLTSAAKAAGIKIVGRNGMGWVPNGDRKNCTVCKKKFTVKVRRHHCRFCGEVICNSCSKNRIRIPGQPKPVRTCDECVANKKSKKEIKEVKKR